MFSSEKIKNYILVFLKGPWDLTYVEYLEESQIMDQYGIKLLIF